MKVASAFSTWPDTVEALDRAYAGLVEKLGGAPTWMAVHTTEEHPAAVVTAALAVLAPGVAFQGGTSCLGVMTEAGFHSDQGVGLGILGIRDPDGAYGVASAELEIDAWQAGYNAITAALQNTDRATPPALVWMTCAPGAEEEILAGIEAGLGGMSVPIIGGSSADNRVIGKWYQVTNNRALRNGVVVTALFPSTRVRYAFDNSYTPTSHTGTITRASGRTVYTIDHRPAAQVYNEWTNGAIAHWMDGGNILSPSTLYPLGRTAVWSAGITLYQLSHPEAVLDNGALALFTQVEVGEEIVLMKSSAHDLVYRVNRVTSRALADIQAPGRQVAGALVIYCAGCMLAVKRNMHKVAAQFHDALAGQPFLGLFSNFSIIRG